MSGDAAQAQRLYRAGMDAYGRQAYEEALSAFDRAVSLGDRSWKVLDAKAAAMNKMGGAWRTAAFETASSLCKKYGDKSHRPWYRAASILLELGLLDAAERSITRGLALASASDAAARKPLLNLREVGKRKRSALAARRDENVAEAEATRKATMCFAHLLTPDILYLVAKAGDGDTPLRMAGVCQDWRGAMLSHSSLWGHLRLGRRRPAAKAATWVDRSRGRIKSIEITRYVAEADTAAIAAELASSIENVESVNLHYLTQGASGRYFAAWQGRCRALRELKVKSDPRVSQHAMFRLLHHDCCSLEVVEMITAHLTPTPIVHSFDIGTGIPIAPAQLAALRHLVLGHGVVHSDQAWVLALAAAAPRLAHLELRCTNHTISPADEDPITLEHLTHLEVCDRTGLLTPTKALHTPNLSVYSAWNWHTRSSPGPPLSVLDNVRGLPPTLTSLDIGRCGLNQAELLGLLPEFTSLRFLNVSFCGIDNTLLEALVDGILPNLTALSLAGHDVISAGPLRRLVYGRLGIEAAKAKPASVKRSAFAPKKRSKPEASASQPTSQLLQAGPKVPITWICVDQCNGMAVEILSVLRKHVPFISNQNGPVVEDRVRGRGAFAWDSDLACEHAAEGCHLRKRRADEDGWYVHHTCKQARQG
ncbi:hypothetical protein CspeluHIS016_0604050 [Cutaneotrichosporon spelunceum]|uniref:F-box domain-containing protein n=1 Tax=Cutaneotrichosporon spelunceum TaxID=1672016 RepID=A0AAD3TXZ1_9TREE|nr:hypothetical protein CspeluHIS016_0604050 [Cutaneotrichosporon spelunceum]